MSNNKANNAPVVRYTGLNPEHPTAERIADLLDELKKIHFQDDAKLIDGLTAGAIQAAIKLQWQYFYHKESMVNGSATDVRYHVKITFRSGGSEFEENVSIRERYYILNIIGRIIELIRFITVKILNNRDVNVLRVLEKKGRFYLQIYAMIRAQSHVCQRCTAAPHTHTFGEAIANAISAIIRYTALRNAGQPETLRYLDEARPVLLELLIGFFYCYQTSTCRTVARQVNY